MNMMNIAIVGYTKIAKCFVEQIHNQSEKLKVIAISDDSLTSSPVEGANLITQAYDAVSVPDVDVVILCEERLTKAYEIARDALERGKHVVTNNQTLMAVYGSKLWMLSQDKGVHLRFEGAVLGGAPVMDMLMTSFNGLHVQRLYGVLNSTCNYALSRMKERGVNLSDALSDAEELGYSESDMSLDISGKDSLYKMSLLKTAAFGEWVDVNKAEVHALEQVTSADIQLAQQFGMVVKMLATATKDHLKVSPTLIEEFSQVGNTSGTLAGVVVETSEAGPLFLASHGADFDAIASAMLSDTQAIFKKRKLWSLKKLSAEKPKQDLSRYFVRLPEGREQKLLAANHIQRIEEQRILSSGKAYLGFIVETGMPLAEVKALLMDGQEHGESAVFDVFTE